MRKEKELRDALNILLFHIHTNLSGCISKIIAEYTELNALVIIGRELGIICLQILGILVSLLLSIQRTPTLSGYSLLMETRPGPEWVRRVNPPFTVHRMVETHGSGRISDCLCGMPGLQSFEMHSPPIVWLKQESILELHPAPSGWGRDRHGTFDI